MFSDYKLVWMQTLATNYWLTALEMPLNFSKP